MMLNMFFEDFGSAREMVLSTSYNDVVSSRMMSVILLDRTFFFQTSNKLNKYQQIKKNKNVSLCIGNISITGVCKELGKPKNYPEFCCAYERHYKGAYDLYTNLEEERLFFVTPVSAEKWIYENGKPYLEKYDFVNDVYSKNEM